MHCPKCKSDTRVTDSRAMSDRNGIKRRRMCLAKSCGHLFTTYEEFENSENITELRSLRVKVQDLKGVLQIELDRLQE